MGLVLGALPAVSSQGAWGGGGGSGAEGSEQPQEKTPLPGVETGVRQAGLQHDGALTRFSCKVYAVGAEWCK